LYISRKMPTGDDHAVSPLSPVGTALPEGEPRARWIIGNKTINRNLTAECAMERSYIWTKLSQGRTAIVVFAMGKVRGRYPHSESR